MTRTMRASGCAASPSNRTRSPGASGRPWQSTARSRVFIIFSGQFPDARRAHLYGDCARRLRHLDGRRARCVQRLANENGSDQRITWTKGVKYALCLQESNQNEIIRQRNVKICKNLHLPITVSRSLRVLRKEPNIRRNGGRGSAVLAMPWSTLAIPWESARP